MDKFARSTNSRATLALITFQAVAVIVCECIFFHFLSSGASNYKEDKGKGLPTYFAIFLAAQIFQLVLVADAIRMQNTIQIIGSFAFNICLFTYSILQYFQIDSVLNEISSSTDNEKLWKLCQSLLIPVILVTAICQIIYGWLAFRLYQEFGWTIYKNIGADLQKRRMYRDYHICIMVLKLDFFFFMGFGIQLLVLAIDSQVYEYVLTIAALPISLLAIMMANYALKREKKKTMRVVFVCLLAASAYFIAKIYIIWKPSNKAKYELIKKYLTSFAVLALLAVVATIAISIRCYKNFGRGLRPYLMRESNNIEMMQPGRTRIVLEEEDDDDYELDGTHSPNSTRPFASRPANVLSMQL
ncbi:hypothetical protein BDF19DRAFT_452416 [Syncephalis fuscata]|nr:hypothetical protein BDF19DRAFT_452416 [Syncephalis fuscata]